MRVFWGVFVIRLEKLAAEWVLGEVGTLKLFRMPKQLRQQVKIKNRLEELGYRPKTLVRIDLFQMSLREAKLVSLVGSVRSVLELFLLVPRTLVAQIGVPVSPRFLLDADFIHPFGRIGGSV